MATQEAMDLQFHVAEEFDFHIVMHELSFFWIVEKPFTSYFLKLLLRAADIPITSCFDVINSSNVYITSF